MKRKPFKLTAMEEEALKQKLQQLSQQDDIQLPESLRSANLLAKLQEQPSFVRIDSDPAPRRRSVYVITTCAAALLLVVGLTRFMPGMNSSGNGFALTSQTADKASSMASMAVISNEGGISDYQEIIAALQYLTSAGANSDDIKAGNAPIVASVMEEEDVDGTSPESNKNPQAGFSAASKPERALAGGGENTDAPEEKSTGLETPATMPVSSSMPAASSPDHESNLLKRSSNSMSDSNTEAAPAEEEDDADIEPYILEAAPSYSNPGLVSATQEWSYWLDTQSNTLQQLNSKTMEPSAAASIPLSAYVTYMESYGELVACIDPFQMSYYDESGLASSKSSGITVYLYQTGEEQSLNLVNIVSMSGDYEACYLSNDGHLYLVANQQVYTDAETIGDVLQGLSSSDSELDSRLSDVLPVVYNESLDKSPSLMPPAQISLIGTPVDLNYLNVMVIDLANSGACTFWGFLGRKGSLAISGNTISMAASDGENGIQMVSIDFSNDRVSYRLSLSIAPEPASREHEEVMEFDSQGEDGTYYPPPA